ncbi:unnamed protein product [Meganyctiphanes norvegica]|uniref:Uncharacterized protein n=1 Tax=Meganyctiphanes norvegica TaxID=48144 RepID=A0AAV2R388_MEGNR
MLVVVTTLIALVSFIEAIPLGQHDGTSISAGPYGGTSVGGIARGKALGGSSSRSASSGGPDYIDRGTYRVYGARRTPLIIKFDLVGAAYNVPASTGPGNPGRSRIIQAELVGLCLDYPRCTNRL